MDTPNIPTTNPPDFLAQEEKRYAFFVEFGSNSLESLKAKYGEKALFEKVFAVDESLSTFAKYFEFQRQIFVAKFYPKDQPVNIDKAQKNQIVNLMAGIKPEHTPNQIQAWINEINPVLIWPQNFQIEDIQKQAYLLYTAFNNLENLLLDNFSHEYLQDTMALYQKSPGELQAITTEVTLISEAIEQEFQGITQNTINKINQDLINRALNLLERIGRSQFFINSEKEKASLSHLADIFIKLDVAIRAAQALKNQANIPTVGFDQFALAEIKKVLKPGIQI